MANDWIVAGIIQSAGTTILKLGIVAFVVGAVIGFGIAWLF